MSALVAPFGLIAVSASAVRAGRTTRRLRREERKPRLVYGPTPIISIRYMSEAMRRRGYETFTSVYGVYSINLRSDYDATLDDLLGRFRGPVAAGLRELLGPYVAFSRALRRGDIFHFFFDGGFLRATPLRFLEVRLLHLAGKRVVVMPYGRDVAIPSELHAAEWRRAFELDYPDLVRGEAKTRRWIDHFCRRADFVVACLVHFETLPRWDLLTTHYYPIDTDAWRPVEGAGPGSPITVFHSSNHRSLKGTEAVVQACTELRAEGHDVELALAEGVPNSEVKRLLQESDIVAEQFVRGYALAAMEAMALAKPVLSNLSDPWYYDRFRKQTGLDECPIVDTAPGRLTSNLERLLVDAELRTRLGEAGRSYVVKYHSYEAVGRMWEAVYGAVWENRPIGAAAWHPDRVAAGEASAVGEPAGAGGLR